MKKLIFMMLALVCFTACTNDDENGLENNNGTMVPGEEESRAVELNDTTLTLYPDTDKDTVEIGAEKGWWIEEIATDEATVKPTAEEKQLMAEGGAYNATCDWISVKRAGSGIEVAVGMIDCAKRTCRLTLATEDTTATVTVVQSDWITGDWDDNIGLSTKSVTLNGAGEPVTIKTEGKNWWIATIKVDGEILYNFIEDGTENRNMYQTGMFNLKCGWLKVNVEDWTLSISADMNHGAERTFKITLESGDYFDHIDGNQEELLTGTGTPINLSPTSVTLPAGGGTLCCTTNEKCTNWTILDITIDGKTYKSTLNEWNEWSYMSTFEKTCEWLTVKCDNEKLYVTAEPNTTGKERIFTVRLFADDMHDVLNGTQPAE